MSGERRTGWEEAERWFSADPPRGGDGGGGGGGGEEPEGPPPVPRCEVCGAELEPDQTYCLECGSPTPLAPRLRRGGRAAAILAGAMVVLGVGGGALAYALVSDDDDDPAGATSPTTVTTATTATGGVLPPPTGPLPTDTSVTTPTAPTTPTSPTTTGFETVTGPTPTSPTTTGTTSAATETEPEPTPPPDSGASDWPAGETAWTAVLSSVRSESDARVAKERLRASGEPAGVLFSSEIPGLRPGYWVLFSGTYAGRAQAVSQAATLRSEFPDAYARRIQG